MGLKYTKMYTKLRNPERKFEDVTEELAKEILYSKKRKKDWIRICRGDGIVIFWFRHEFNFEQTAIALENNEEEPWLPVKEKCFSFSDEYENYNIWVVEFNSQILLDEYEQKMIDDMTRAYYGIKEDTGKYSIWDVYSPSELGL